MLNNNLIVIYAKSGTGKSRLGTLLLNVFSANKKACYIELEEHNNISVTGDVAIRNDINDMDTYLREYDIILIDYLELANYSIDDIKELKEIAVSNNKTIILISCCSFKQELFGKHYKKLKEVSDLIIT